MQQQQQQHGASEAHAVRILGYFLDKNKDPFLIGQEMELGTEEGGFRCSEYQHQYIEQDKVWSFVSPRKLKNRVGIYPLRYLAGKLRTVYFTVSGRNEPNTGGVEGRTGSEAHILLSPYLDCSQPSLPPL
jgi:hypothetical protein